MFAPDPPFAPPTGAAAGFGSAVRPAASAPAAPVCSAAPVSAGAAAVPDAGGIASPPAHGLPVQAYRGREHRTRVKICGLTCAEDTALALDLGADALGFNFYPKSSRCLDPAADLAWLRGLPTGARRVAVVVNAGRALIDSLLRARLVDSVQLHGDEEADFCAGLRAAGVRFARAIRVRDARALERPERFHTADLLLDAFHPGAYGGTGRQVDWDLAAGFAREQAAQGRRVILSGGLTPENVAEGIARVRPFAVDVASGVEEPGNPRRKNAARLREFFAAVRAADALQAAV